MKADKPAHYYDPYDALAPIYDTMARALLFPFGGEKRFRSRATAALDLQPGTRVLELGCGTGSMTALLLSAGASVTSADLSEPMLERARRKAPGATFVRADITQHDFGTDFERVLFSFVLHEMTEDIRVAALRNAARSAPRGLVGVLDFSRPSSAVVRWPLKAYLRVAAPEVTFDFLTRVLESAL
jgi:demethylmenaquinone methyltransferase/2-methoxy-6-polyprenyl-1,4-benzoquinol methylase